MLSRALQMAFWVMYDHLGKLVFVNILWAIAVIVPGVVAFVAILSGEVALALYIGLPLLIGIAGVVVPVGFAGFAYMVKILIEKRDGSIHDFFSGIRQYGFRAIGLGLIQGMSMVCLLVSIWFYAAKLHDTVPWLGYILSGIAVWIAFFAGLMAMYSIPALIQKKSGTWATLKLAALLVLDNPGFTVALAVQFAVLLIFTLSPVIVFLVPPELLALMRLLASVGLFVLVLFSGALAMVLAMSAYEVLARQYMQVEKALAEAGHTGAPVNRRLIMSKVRAAFEAEAAQDDYLNRGFRDFLFPWKG